MDENPDVDFEHILKTLELDSRTLDLPPGATVVPLRSAPRPTSHRLLQELPHFAIEATGEKRPELEWLRLIGEGGMGRVGLARQVGLERNVAVKTPKSANDPRVIEGIMQEAYITGLVEHPNVIPIYSLGRDAKGAPLIVMKRIEGTSWAEVLALPSDDPASHELVWHIRVLVQVCNAIRYAHRRGIVHRDIKPENIMIGEFGEVYVLDWGIALSVDGTESALKPTRATAMGLAGTPAYMAPEMTVGDAFQIDARTDVYLLGATLTEVISGKPPHDGNNLVQVLRAAFESSPVSFSDDAPKSLVAIAHRAMARDKNDRYASVDEFTEAIEAFLEHRGSVVLADASLLVLDKLEAGLRKGHTSISDSTDLFAECRFGFRQALTQWPENQVARDGLVRTARTLAVYYLALGNVASARATLDAMDAPDPELLAKVEAAERAKEAEAAHVLSLSRIAERFDPRVAQGLRSILMVVAGLTWGASSLWTWANTDFADTDAARMAHLWQLGRPILIGLIIVVAFRRSFLANEFNRRFGLIVVGVFAGLVAIRVGVVLSETPMTTAIWIEYPLYMMSMGAVGILFKKRLAFLGVPFLVTTIAGAIDPTNAALYLAICHVVVFCFIAWVWRPKAGAGEV